MPDISAVLFGVAGLGSIYMAVACFGGVISGEYYWRKAVVIGLLCAVNLGIAVGLTAFHLERSPELGIVSIAAAAFVVFSGWMLFTIEPDVFDDGW